MNLTIFSVYKMFGCEGNGESKDIFLKAIVFKFYFLEGWRWVGHLMETRVLAK